MHSADELESALSAGVDTIMLWGVSERYYLSVTINVVARNLTLRSVWPGGVTLDGGSQRRVMSLGDNAIVRLIGVQIAHGVPPADAFGGGAFFVGAPSARLRLERCHVHQNRATGAPFGGAAFFIFAGVVELFASRVTDNRADGFGQSGGAVLMAGGRMVLVRTEVSRNFASNAGAFYLLAGTLELHECALLDNACTFGGGTFHLLDLFGASSTTLQDCDVNGSSTQNDGGAFYVLGGATVVIQRSRVAHNRANIGGGFYVLGTTNVTLDQVQALNNTADAVGDGGGGFYIRESARVRMSHSAIRDNRAVAKGGALLLLEQASLLLDDVTIDGNVAASGGGMFVFSGAVVMRGPSRMVDNVALNGIGHQIFPLAGRVVFILPGPPVHPRPRHNAASFLPHARPLAPYTLTLAPTPALDSRPSPAELCP